MKRDNYKTNAANPATAALRLNSSVWALENAKTQLTAVLLAGHAHPFFQTVQIELLNLDYVLRSLPIERDEQGRPLHPADCKRGAK